MIDVGQDNHRDNGKDLHLVPGSGRPEPAQDPAPGLQWVHAPKVEVWPASAKPEFDVVQSNPKKETNA